MKKVFFIDPQSYHNLSVYDYELLTNVKDIELFYFHNVKYQLSEMPSKEHSAVFSYSDKKGVAKGMSYARSLIKIAIHAWKLRPEVVHIQWLRAFTLDKIFLKFLHIIGSKVVFTAHNVVPHEAGEQDEKNYAWYYRHVDAIIVHTERSKHELQEQFRLANKVEVIPHGLLPMSDNFEEVEHRRATLSKELQTEGKIIFSLMGHQDYYKGTDLVADAWLSSEGLHSNEQCMLLIIGKNKNVDLSRLKGCRNVVIVDEIVSSIDFEAYLRLTSVVLLPYRKISQSGVLLTCIDRGVPVVVTDVGGLTDPLKYGEVGWNIGQATVESLKKILLQLINAPQQITAVANNHEAYERIKEVYSWKTIGQATSALYSRITKS